MMSPLVHQKGVDLVIEKDRLDHMRRAAMAQAFSWTQSARSYAAIYKSSIQAGNRKTSKERNRLRDGCNSTQEFSPMRRSKPQPIRNKLDLADRTQVRLVRKRLGLSDSELTSIVDRIGNSIAAISKEAAQQRATTLPKPDDVPPGTVIAAAAVGEQATAEITATEPVS
ncbi:hypothetical protein ACVWW2_007129 [Bradyrhizobium sp. LM4.3]